MTTPGRTQSRSFYLAYFIGIFCAMALSAVFTMSVIGAAAGGGSFVLGVVYGWTARAAKGDRHV